MIFGIVGLCIIILMVVLIWNACEWIAQKLGK